MSRSRSTWQWRPWSKKLGLRLRTGPLRGVLGELAFYLGLIFVGVFVFTLVLVTQVMVPRIGIDLPPEARVVLDSDLAHGGGHWGRWVVAMVSVATIGSGMFGLGYRLLHLGFSRERISARSKTLENWKKPAHSGNSEESSSTDDQETSRANDQLSDEYPQLPAVPRLGTLDESPGERLRYRLASVSTGRLAIIGAASLALIWNSVCVVLLAVAISGWWYDRPRPILAMLLVPFAGVAVWSLKSFLRQVRQVAGVGPTVLEISDHPLQPGGAYALFISQIGRMRLRRLKIELVCEEESFFRQGTDVRSDHHVALSEELLSEGPVRVDPQAPWEQQLEFELPANVMHSFCSTNNSVRWRLIVSGEARPWPSFCRSFPLIVHPPLMVPPNSPR
ncbi:hypothetical protein SAMN06265222_103368 [Neorhodopirellula lusitana]|uniref:Uncharacterized protein n=1 Tax=Neorhodopirellula lusitana TaxID=445327 RepID=A0ABY1PXK2_9BACT|nr:hypothetical protein [Neorhodopirellula lusitana]SMP51881.1 hypothetical protein SAMN06265222_103368 [Neorhodopirellula lusitana]